MASVASVIPAATLVAALGLNAGPAVAQPLNLNVAAKAASCNACHGPSGNSIAGIPPLAGRPADELFALLAAFKNGRRDAFVMHQHAKGYSDEELRDIAADFSRQRLLQDRK
jgi:cytochrome c553